MASSGKRARAFGHLLEAAGAQTDRKPARPGFDSIVRRELLDEVRAVYAELGGRSATPRLAPGPWDFALDGIVVELDEENHFTRYRAMTLRSPIYDRLSGFGICRYRTYCDVYESHCLTYGRYWTSAPTEREFGASGEPGRLDSGLGLGSARWKQRAFYDFLKDLAPLTP